ncbi:MAG: ATP-binding cassette domain-containing protein [Promethearchaeota archaeon]
MNNEIFDIEVFNITKTYPLKKGKKYITALDNINFKINRGEIFGLLGPNGAGKTTMVSILTTLIKPTKGSAKVLGHDILKKRWFIRENVGLMFGGDMIYHRLTGYRNLKFFSKLYGIKDYKKKIIDLAEKFDLAEWLNQSVSTYSTGMRLKLALARVLLINPQLLFLDEPMLGLDPKSVREVIKILKNLNRTIFLTSHQMDIVSRLCNRIAFLKEGKIIKIDTPDNLKKVIAQNMRIEIELLGDQENFIKDLNQIDFVSEILESEKKKIITIKNGDYLPELLNLLKNYPIIHINELTPNLEDIFIELVR